MVSLEDMRQHSMPNSTVPHETALLQQPLYHNMHPRSALQHSGQGIPLYPNYGEYKAVDNDEYYFGGSIEDIENISMITSPFNKGKKVTPQSVYKSFVGEVATSDSAASNVSTLDAVKQQDVSKSSVRQQGDNSSDSVDDFRKDLKSPSLVNVSGVAWALCGAMLYACYMVFLRRKVKKQDEIDIPMFFGEFTVQCVSSFVVQTSLSDIN